MSLGRFEEGLRERVDRKRPLAGFGQETGFEDGVTLTQAFGSREAGLRQAFGRVVAGRRKLFGAIRA